MWGVLLAGAITLAFCSPAPANHSLPDVLSTGPSGGNNSSFHAYFGGASKDAKRAFFTTAEKLVTGDTDSSIDLYERSGGTTTLVSTVAGGGNGAFNVTAGGVSSDGTRAFFETKESLAGGDSDGFRDVYERSGGVTTLVSAGGNGAFDAFFRGASSGGAHVFFTTDESPSGQDSDGGFADVYERSGGVTTLVSTVAAGGNGSYDASFAGATQDGTRVFFSTDESLADGDSDGALDVYERSSGTTTRISRGSIGGNDGTQDAFFQAVSQDGTRVFFRTFERLEPEDGETEYQDVYERSVGTTKVVSIGSIGGSGAFDAIFGGISQDGTRAFFSIEEGLVGGDTDGRFDVYERSGGTTTLVSTVTGGGNGPNAASFGGSSKDGTRVFFQTNEGLYPSDTDSQIDVYERHGGTTTLLTNGSAGGNGGYAAFFTGASDDGKRVFFNTFERLEGTDNDSNWQDLYEHSNGSTTQVSTGPTSSAPIDSAYFAAASEDGERVLFTTSDNLVSADTDTAQDLYASSVGPYPRPTGGATFRFPLVPAFTECAQALQNSLHEGNLASDGACSNPQLSSSTVTLGSSVAAGTRIGYGDIAVCTTPQPPSGLCSASVLGPAPDVRLRGNASDIVCKSGAPAAACPGGAGSDYDPNTPAGPYTGNLSPGADSNAQVPQPICNPSPPNPSTCAVGADMTARAVIPGSSASGANRTMRITDSFNSLRSVGDSSACPSSTSCSATVRDQAFPVPIVCKSNGSGSPGSYCGVNTTANSLVPGVVVQGKGAAVQIGQVQVFDSGPDGIANNGDDQLFAVQGIYIP